MKTLTKNTLAISLISLFLASQAAMALDEEQEKIPPVKTEMTTPHGHEMTNSENENELLTDTSQTAETKDGHHDVKEIDDTNQ